MNTPKIIEHSIQLATNLLSIQIPLATCSCSNSSACFHKLTFCLSELTITLISEHNTNSIIVCSGTSYGSIILTCTTVQLYMYMYRLHWVIITIQLKHGSKCIIGYIFISVLVSGLIAKNST